MPTDQIPLLTCADFPNLDCCDGCHCEWTMPDCPDPVLHAVWTPEGRLAVVCCTVAAKVARRPGAKEGRLHCVAWMDATFGAGWEAKRR